MPTVMMVVAESGLMSLNFLARCLWSITEMLLAQYIVTVLAIISLHVTGLRLTHQHLLFRSKSFRCGVTVYAGVYLGWGRFL